ncbi:MAG: prepilin-type N-terminal cleavage/methylation domain-containing protein [Phycisphaerales bacterium]
MSCAIQAPSRRPARTGFTLIELMVVVAVVALLISITLPILSSAMESAKGFSCQMAQRTVAFDFQLFADQELHGDRGDDSGRSSFRIETFQESQYGVDEFWRWGDGVQRHETPDAEGNDPMRCPSVRHRPLVMRRNFPCSDGAISPPQNVSFGFNARLDRVEMLDARGRPRAVAVRLRSDILEQSMVPLLMDVDGERANELGANAVYVAPSLDSQGPYANDRLWFPGKRHNGKANVAFVDGHVDSSSTPDREAGWKWEYEPRR